MKERLLFLDIDGVLNDLQWDQKETEMIEEKRVEILAKIVKETGAKIILSSTWRYIKDCDEAIEPEAAGMWKYLMNMLEKYELRIYDVTPTIDGNRPHEIQKYLEKHKNALWCSIEDDFSHEDYKKYGIEEHLVQTCYFTETQGGLQEKHIEIVKQIFGMV